jgi:hypothetical protein
MRKEGKYFYRLISDHISHIKFDDLIVEDIDSTIDDIMFLRSSLFVGVLKKYLVCVESTYFTDGIEIDGSTLIKNLSDK